MIRNAKILSLKSAEPDEKIVKMLEHLLEEAKSGKYLSLIAIVEYPETYGAIWTGCTDKAKRLGMLELTKMGWILDRESDG